MKLFHILVVSITIAILSGANLYACNADSTYKCCPAGQRWGEDTDTNFKCLPCLTNNWCPGNILPMDACKDITDTTEKTKCEHTAPIAPAGAGL